MGTGYPGDGSYFEKLGEALPPEYLELLKDDSTDEENKDVKRTLLTKLDESLALQYKYIKELTDEKS